VSSLGINDKNKKFQPSFLLFLFANWSLNPKMLPAVFILRQYDYFANLFKTKLDKAN